jgi:hypothetical protein
MPFAGKAQYYSGGADPASIRWKQSKVHGFNLICPENEPELAAGYRSILSDILAPATASMPSGIRSLPVIIHPYASFSNGFSALAPRRIELYPKQPLALETNDFAPQLLIHEVRHFAQMESLNHGITRAAGYILGEQALSVVLGLHVPGWLLEGDAVLAETLLSQSGRGRIAGFIEPLRSRLIDNKDLSWDRVWFGSYNDILPDEYLFGYFLAARGRMLSDPMIWSDALQQIGRNPFNIRSLSGITRPKTGYRFSKLYVETLEWLRDFWTGPTLAPRPPEGMENLVSDSLDYRNYFRPQFVSPGKVICLKKSMSDIPAFVLIDSSQNESIIARPGYIEDAGFTYYRGKLAWTELIGDPRWENRSWSDLFIFDSATARKTRLSRGERLFSPAFSPGGDRIAVIEERPDGSSRVQVIRSADGSVISSHRKAGTDHFSFICWGERSDELLAVTTGREGRKLIRIDLREMTEEILLNAGYTDIASPAAHGGYVYFSGPAGASQGLYRLKPGNTPELVFKHPHGINYLSSQGDDLYLSAYSSNGYRPAKIAFNQMQGRSVNRIEPLTEPVTGIIQRAAGEFPVVYTDSVRPFEVKPYNKIAHLLKLHSWSPVFINPDSYRIKPGVVLMSQNDLSTLVSWAGYQYNKTDLSHNLVASLRYTGLYPEMELDYTRKYRYAVPAADSSGNFLDKFPGAYWQFIRAGTGIPLDFTSGAWRRKVRPSLFLEYDHDLSGKSGDPGNSSWMAGLSLSSSLLRKMSYRDLFPKWGVTMNAVYFRAFTGTDQGDNLTGRLMVYLPGLLPNSSLRILNSAFSLTSARFYDNLLDFPRGQVVYEANRSYNLKIDYSFPVSYPDYHLSWLIYVKRIKANLFFDAGTQYDESNWFLSTGLDLMFDYHLFRVGIELESGVRMLYFPATRKPGAEFLFAFSVN